jgi:hypothetical protein
MAVAQRSLIWPARSYALHAGANWHAGFPGNVATLTMHDRFKFDFSRSLSIYSVA